MTRKKLKAFKIRANEPEKFEKALRQTFLTEVIKDLHDRFSQVEVSAFLTHKDYWEKIHLLQKS